MKKTLLLAALASVGALGAAELKVTADRIAADRRTGSLVATGGVRAAVGPVCLLSQLVTKSPEGVYSFSDPTHVTSCTNDWEHLHWQVSGDVVYSHEHYVIVRNAWLRMFGLPVAWLPYWYYPLDTDYGLRMMPGYASRWGAYLLTKYVYGLAGDFDQGHWGLRGATRFDARTKSGFALGQSLYWQLGDWGRGKFRVYYAWDLDADRYDRRWASSRHRNWRNWGSEVPNERYGLEFHQRLELTERDSVRVKAAYYSDSHFRRDFLRDTLFGLSSRFMGHEGNEAVWEHVERTLGAGLSVSGPVNEFYGGTSRLPEFYLDIAPQPVFGLPLTYESSSRIGYLNRDYATYGDRTTALPFRYNPGIWADFNTFRFDTYHRLALPLKLFDTVSAVPRAGYRATYWEETGYTSTDGLSRAGTTGHDAWRQIVEGGLTLSARGTADFDGGWRHIVEPYLDVLAQAADIDGLRRGERPYVFDALDASVDWFDQFAGRSRNLPYSWCGLTPGLRNELRKTDEKGVSRTVFDFDVYAAVQLNDADWTFGDRYHRLAARADRPNYGGDAGIVVPGVRARWNPSKDVSVLSRIEYDTENDKVAAADLAFQHRVSEHFKWHVDYFARDHRMWDFSSTPWDPEELRNESFNWARMGFLEAGFEHEVCDAFAWSPYVRWDCREAELDEIGAWIDIRTDCLGFRFSISYENDYRRLDWSKSDDDWRFGFFIYLRALGPSMSSVFGH